MIPRRRIARLNVVNGGFTDEVGKFCVVLLLCALIIGVAAILAPAVRNRQSINSVHTVSVPPVSFVVSAENTKLRVDRRDINLTVVEFKDGRRFLVTHTYDGISVVPYDSVVNTPTAEGQEPWVENR